MRLILIFLVANAFLACQFRKSEKKQKNSIVADTILTIKVKPDEFIPKLPGFLDENSGLVFHKNIFWTFNDSGGTDVVFGFNTNGKVKNEIKLKGAKNVDWESIAQDNKYFYIGDFGNNTGYRENLKIYKFSKKKVTASKKVEKKVEVIRFKYKNQTSFKHLGRNHEFDCEAMFAKDSSLYLFSKDWKNRQTTIYRAPKEKGEYELLPLAKWNADGLITGADISSDGKYFSLVGYKNYAPFIWLFKWDDKKYFSEKAVRIDLQSVLDAQTEGICFFNENKLLVSCEETKTFPAKLFSVDIKKAIEFLNE